MPGRDIVCIGASAGGINALIDFFRALPPAEAADRSRRAKGLVEPRPGTRTRQPNR